ncbi:MAG: sulfite exporter TauE/SafE family protein [Clostridia bacterium]|nr:sulfite exporter TauE/SafE family protein [Clostridia bacterium]
MRKWQKIVLCILCGGLIGFINGFLGAGGGVLLVPFLHYMLKDETKVAHATAILIMLPISVVSAVIYVVQGQFVFDVTLPVLIGSAIGGVIGAMLLSKLKSNIIIIIFSIVLVASGIYMFITI